MPPFPSYEEGFYKMESYGTPKTPKSSTSSSSSSEEESAKAAVTENFSSDFLQSLEPLKSIWLFIVQPNVDDYGITIADFFHPNLTHEISSGKRHLLLKGTMKRKLQLPFMKERKAKGVNNAAKIIKISSLNGRKIAAVEFENSSLANEAIISVPPGHPRGRVSKFGGKYEPPSYSVTLPESEMDELFTVENSPSNTLSSAVLDYNIVKPGLSNKLIGRVSSKSGLSFMLHLGEGTDPLDKVVLLGLVIAMDMLKQGKSLKKNNEYEYEC